LENGGKSIERDSDLGHHLVWKTYLWKMFVKWKICGKSMVNRWEIYGTCWENGAPTVATSIALVICCRIGRCQSLSTASVCQEHV
jgi:hypothetical protein